jgi:ABC-type uncharacterized transport system involved in gliding motility auxiliary subunit
MKRWFALQAAVATLLLFLVAIHSSRVVNRHLSGVLHLGGWRVASLRAETRHYLSGIHGRVSLTYFVSSRESMPSAMQGMEKAVRSLLWAMKAENPDHVDYRVLDPDLDPDNGVAYASSHGASPVKVRKVLQDASDERAVWSTLVIAHERSSDAVIQGITPADLPYLEDLIVQHIEAMRHPRPTVVGIASPPSGFESLAGIAKTHAQARVVRVDLERDSRIPPEVEVLFWIEPGSMTQRHVEEIRRFLDSGRTVVLAGSAYSVVFDASDPGGEISYRIRPASCDWNALLRPFGLRMDAQLLLDEAHEPIASRLDDGSLRHVKAPFQIRVLPSQYNTKSFLGPNAGALLIGATSALRVDSRLLAVSGYRAEVVATTSELTRRMDLPAGTFDDRSMAEARSVPKQPWMVLLKPEDSWKGELLVMGSSGLFRDEIINQKRNANAVFLRTLLRTVTETGRLARVRVSRSEPEQVPSLSLTARVAWRAFTVFFLPVVLLVVALRLKSRVSGMGRSIRWMIAIVSGYVVLVVCVLFLRGGVNWALPSVDVTAQQLNTPSPLTQELLGPYREELWVEILITDRLFMPVSMKTLETELRGALRALGVRSRIVRPEDLSVEGREELRASGVAPFVVDSVQDEVEISVSVWSALRLRYRDKVEVIPRLDRRALSHLEFLLAAAVKRFETGTGPHVGVLSDLPRLSPAEAHEDYQKKGRVAPVGSDVYSRVKDLLKQHGYRVSYINPKAPVFPENMDLLLWLQPRNAQKTIPEFSRYLAAGGKAVVALQSFNIQQRQYRGAGFQTVYWPQPQFHRFNNYLKVLGARQVGEKRGGRPGEILFDRNRGHLVLETQIQRSAFREYEPQQVARPFLIRALGAGLSPRSVITSRLGTLLFIWGNRFSLDREQLRRTGLTSEVLVSTSSHAWIYDWMGGWIPEEAFHEPEGTDLKLDGRQPLAVLMQGTFPLVEMQKGEQGRQSLVKVSPPRTNSQQHGALVLIGCSEMFKNPYLHAPGLQHDQFILNVVAYLTHGRDMAEVQSRERTAKSFPLPSVKMKIGLRILVVGLAPLLLLLYGSFRFWRRRRPILVP